MTLKLKVILIFQRITLIHFNDVRAFGRLYFIVLGKIEGPAWEVPVIDTVTYQCPNVPKYKIYMLFPGIPAIRFRPITCTFDL